MKEEVALPDISRCISKFKQTFKHVAEAEFAKLLADATVTAYKKGEFVYEENSRVKGCYLLYSGIVKIFQTGNEGKEQIIRLGKEGDLFGFRSVIREEPACTSVETLADCILCHVPGRSLVEAITRSPAFANEMMQIACRELGDANRYIKDIAQKPVRARLAEILLLIAGDFGLEKDGALTLNLTRGDLSNFVGTATETLIRLLSEFKNERLIATRGRRIRLLDVDRLRLIAG
ncbi:MAG: Crp/Fnr family transcriptional regulator [Odoribacteraceae bacterium]|jgi:CRP-like cAMP-binding protein|nr:Crp/Fnr family transcriptional regulator [Odoribacteraceae bacterium]